MQNLDQVTLIDETDRVLGVMDKVEAHRGTGMLHRAISTFLFNEKGELLTQKRSEKKIVGAGLWANTCCGNVRPTENYLECAERRLLEELGINGVVLKETSIFRYQVQCNAEFSENELDHVFVGKFDGEVKMNPDEVQAVRWVKLDEVQSELHKTSEYAPWFVMLMEDEKVSNSLVIGSSGSTPKPVSAEKK